jgi:hypothetical protein
MIPGRKESIDPAVLFKNQLHIPYKMLCGEYPTASAFATWMAATILKTKSVPPLLGATPSTLKKILICNSYFGIHYSLILIEAC